MVGKDPFIIGFKSNLDWDTWLSFANLKGRFVYVPKILMYHRIHEESETSNLIGNNIRLEEDLAMLKKIWPEKLANIIMKQYSKSVNSNQIKSK